MRLAQAETEDIKIICTWFRSAAEVKTWAGPGIPFPLESATLQQALQWDACRPYAFFDEENRCIGFAQVFDRFGCCHLSRVALAPELRGRGLGRQLLELLLASLQGDGKPCSLFVYAENSPALKLYEKCGFIRQEWPEGEEREEGCLFMRRDAVAPRQVFAETELEDVAGILYRPGNPLSLEEMEEAIQRGAREKGRR